TARRAASIGEELVPGVKEMAGRLPTGDGSTHGVRGRDGFPHEWRCGSNDDGRQGKPGSSLVFIRAAPLSVPETRHTRELARDFRFFSGIDLRRLTPLHSRKILSRKNLILKTLHTPHSFNKASSSRKSE